MQQTVTGTYCVQNKFSTTMVKQGQQKDPIEAGRNFLKEDG